MFNVMFMGVEHIESVSDILYVDMIPNFKKKMTKCATTNQQINSTKSVNFEWTVFLQQTTPKNFEI